MKAGKSITDFSTKLPLRWLLSMSMAVVGVALCMWLWMKPQLERQTGTWLSLNHEIKMKIAADQKQPIASRTGEKSIYPNRTKSSSSIVSATRSKASSQRINVNAADVGALQTLPGIGPRKAKAIIEYREKKGAFSYVKDLMKVKGIGRKVMEKLQDKVCVN